MDAESIRQQMPGLIRGHIPSNVRSFKLSIFDGVPQKSAMGFFIDPQPFEGTVIAKTDEIVVVQTGRTAFAALNRTRLTEDPDEGVRVHVAPYARRRFDGQRADTPEEKTQIDAEGRPYTVQSWILGSAPAKLPIPQPRCPELQALIEQLECLPAPDRFRCITHLMVDAGARDFTWVDPLPDDIFKTPPAISFTVSSEKFQGRVTVLYRRGLDLYAVELSRNGEIIQQVEDVYVNNLGQVLERLIDDRNWLRIEVRCLPMAKKHRTARK